MPIQHKNHKQEALSRRKFEELIDPWTIINYNQKDYGIDVTVEFTSQVKGTENFEMLGKFLNVQLKSQTKTLKNNKYTSVKIEVDKIKYWFNSNVPVIICLYALDKDAFYFRHVNQDLINEIEKDDKNWLSQDTKSIRIFYADNLSEKTNKDSIFSYVLDWKQAPKKIIPPGKYFDFKDSLESVLTKLSNKATEYKFTSIESGVLNCKESLERALYRIAVTGPSRAGKSSIINALLNFDNKQVSPVDLIQTTAVPIQIFPGHKMGLTIYFQDGTKTETDYNENVIKKYATQTLNPDNKLRVSLLAIHLPLLKLQYGVSYVDAAGLDDPNDEIVDFTMSFIKKCNAIIYIIDASPINHGGFIFRNDFKKHLTDFATNIDRIFLVFNKSDVVTKPRLELLKSQVTKDLTKYSLFEKLKGKIYYLSAQKQNNVIYLDKFSDFEDDLWSFILNENKTGFINLFIAIKEIRGIAANFESLINLRINNSIKASEVNQLISSLRPKVDVLTLDYRNKLNTSKTYLSNYINNFKNQVLNYLEDNLQRIPYDKALPNTTSIKEYLRQNLNTCISNGNIEFNKQIGDIKTMIDKWIETHLKQLQDLVGGVTTKNITFDELDLLKIPDIDYSASLGMGLTSFLGGLLVNPIVGLISGLLGFLGSEIFNSASRRKSQISKLMHAVENSANVSYDKVINAYYEQIDNQAIKIAKYADSKISLYLADLTTQINNLGKVLTEPERNSLKKSKAELNSTVKELDSLFLDMKVYYDPS